MMPKKILTLSITISLFCIINIPFCNGIVVLNEVASSGSSNGQCNGEDWVELYNDGFDTLSLDNYTLYDDKGPGDDSVMTLSQTSGSLSNLAAGEYKVLCKGIDFSFGIGSKDTITLADENGNIVSTTGAMSGSNDDDTTYALLLDDASGYQYTSTPTPGALNIFTEPQRGEETTKEENQNLSLAKQNELGKDFFRLNDDGTRRTSSHFADVVDVYISLNESSLFDIENNPGFEMYVPFTELRIISSNNTNTTTTTVLEYGGSIRPRGQSTLYFPACFGAKNIPFLLDFNSENATQTLFGLEKAYLRNSLFDPSYMREYAIHRANARFGLPFMRTRPVRLYLNDVYTGFYTLMEPPDQAYVMQRSFGAFDTTQSGLFKFKSPANGCLEKLGRFESQSTGFNEAFSDEEIQLAETSSTIDDPPYYKRGTHKDKIPVLGPANFEGCVGFMYTQLAKERQSFLKGYVRSNKNCSEALVKYEQVDRDFGPKKLEDSMITFLEDFKNLGDNVDVDQWLKNFASYAVTLTFDSPINNGNNWFIATTSGGVGDWRIVQYDHNNAASSQTIGTLCAPECSNRQIYWPIMRPTCRSVEQHPIVGPLLTNEVNMKKYLSYVKDFASLLSPDFFQELRDYGAIIKNNIVEDPLNFLPMEARLEAYENFELSPDFDLKFVPPGLESPFLKTLEARVMQVQEQIQALENGTFPRNGGVYESDEVCPDWRDDGLAGTNNTTMQDINNGRSDSKKEENTAILLDQNSIEFIDEDIDSRSSDDKDKADAIMNDDPDSSTTQIMPNTLINLCVKIFGMLFFAIQSFV